MYKSMPYLSLLYVCCWSCSERPSEPWSSGFTN